MDDKDTRMLWEIVQLLTLEQFKQLSKETCDWILEQKRLDEQRKQAS